jgi:hypothetical protein
MDLEAAMKAVYLVIIYSSVAAACVHHAALVAVVTTVQALAGQPTPASAAMCSNLLPRLAHNKPLLLSASQDYITVTQQVNMLLLQGQACYV